MKNIRADIFHQSFLWLLRHNDEPQKGRNSCLWLQSHSVLSSFGVVLMSCRVNFHVVRSALQYSVCRIKYVYSIIFADQVFIDPTFLAYSFAVLCSPLWLMFASIFLCSQTSKKVWGWTLVSLWCGRTGGRAVYGHVITKFSGMVIFS